VYNKAPTVITNHNKLEIPSEQLCACTVSPNITNALQTTFLQQMIQRAGNV